MCARAATTATSSIRIEAAAHPLGAELARGGARACARACAHRAQPLLAPRAGIARARIDDEAAKLDAATAARLQAAARGLEWRARIVLPAWTAMLETLEDRRGARGILPTGSRSRARRAATVDVGLERHWIDPTIPFAGEVLAAGAWRAHHLGDAARRRTRTPRTGRAPKMRTGAHHLPEPPRRASFGSPFDYAAQARIFIVGGRGARRCGRARGGDARIVPGQRAAARSACSPRCARFARSKAASPRPLAEQGIALYAQHVDRLDTGALVDLFRAEENACLLGTDALAGRRRRAGALACALSCSTRCPGRSPPSCTRRGARDSASIMTTCWRGCGSNRPSGGWSGARPTRAVS